MFLTYERCNDTLPAIATSALVCPTAIAATISAATLSAAASCIG